MSNYDDAQWLIQIDRDVFAICAAQVIDGGDPYQAIHDRVMEQPAELQVYYMMELSRRLARNLGNLMLDMHGSQAAAQAAVAGAAMHFEQTVSAGVWTTTTTPPPNDDDGQPNNPQ